jgi:hypothetical protein
MSDDLVNQLTLNFLISKQQLQKLNKKTKETAEQQKIKEIQEYKDRIKLLFNDLLVYQPPEDLLFEVKVAFENFIEKSIYYLKAHDNSEALEIERSEEIHDDIDFEKEERDIVNGNYKEKSEEEEEEQDEDEDEEEEEQDEEEEEQDEEEEEQDEKEEEEQEKEKEYIPKTNNPIKHHPIVVKSKYTKPTSSVGVDDIQKLPLDWFQNVRQSYKKNQIIPRKKEPTIIEPNFRDLKKKI